MSATATRVHAAAIEAYDLTGTRHLVDVGGGNGHLTAHILTRYPDITATVFVQHHVITAAEPVLAAAGVAGRARTAGGDFLDAVPGGGDVYLLSWILHDWDDERAATILTNIRHAMAPGGRVLVIESVLPTGDAPHPAKLMDIIMLVGLGGGNGRERTEPEFTALLEAAGLRHTRTVTTTTSPSSIIEAVVFED